ncbi:MAG: hypothetical protein QXJ11_06235 [Candidatus Bathyarchaeia archaeon]
MKRKAKRRRKTRKIYIYSFFTIAITVILIAAIREAQTPKPSRQKVPANEYFEIKDAIPTEWDESRSTNEYLFITQVRFKLTAIGGDAHHVLIIVPGFSPLEEWPYIDEIKQNKTIDITLPKLQYAYRSIKTEDGYFPFTIRIDSDEAYGNITILIKEQ